MRTVGFIWCAHDGKGAPYVAVPAGQAPYGDTRWHRRRANALPGLAAEALEDYGQSYDVAQADAVGVAQGRGRGCFAVRYGRDGLDAESGRAVLVEVEMSEPASRPDARPT